MEALAIRTHRPLRAPWLGRVAYDRGLVERGSPAEQALHRRHAAVRNAAGNDAGKEGERLVGHVEREPVGRHPAGDVDADRGDLVVADPDRRHPLAHGRPTGPDPEIRERADQDLLEVRDVALDVLAVRGEVEDGVPDELSRAVVGDLAAAVALADLDPELPAALGREKHVRAGGVAPEREDGLVLQQEQRFVVLTGPRGRLGLERESAVVGHAPEPGGPEGTVRP